MSKTVERNIHKYKNKTKHEENNLKMLTKCTIFWVLNFLLNKTFENNISNKR